MAAPFRILGAALLVANACAARTPPSPAPRPADARLEQLVNALRTRHDAGYEGGLTQEDVRLADEFARRAFATGVPRIPCKPSNPRNGEVVATGTPPETQVPTHPVLQALYSAITGGHRKQRDVALVAVANIGPGAAFKPSFLERHGAWTRAALSAVTCERWSPPDVHDMWSPARNARLSATDYPERSRLAVDLMIEQMLDRRFVYPDEVFSGALFNRGYKEHVTAEQARRLLPLLTDDTFAVSVRAQALAFVRELRPGEATSFEGPLRALYDARVPDLSSAAGMVLVRLGSRHGADVLADVLSSDEAQPWPRVWGVRGDCARYPPATDRLIEALLRRLEDPNPDIRITAIESLACLRDQRAVGPLLRALDEPFWSQQGAAAEALGKMATLPGEAVARLEKMSRDHWSAIVRTTAANALATLAGKPPVPMSTDYRLTGFHRTAIDHGLPVCHGKEPGDGKYRLPWLGSFQVRWKEAKVHDIPAGFPLQLREMRARKGYGTNTFLRLPDGWLFSTDLWHYDGDFGFVSNDGKVDRFAPEAAHAAFILRTQLGITVLGQDVFDGGDGGVLAVLDRTPKGGWLYRVVAELPSEAFGHAFAPDGTLLVKEPHGAYAITRKREIVPLACP